VTGLLAIGSEILLGHFDFVRPTWEAYKYLSKPLQTRLDHSSSDRFVVFFDYLLVPPLVVLAWAMTFAGRFRAGLTSHTFVGLVCAGQILAFGYLQFGSTVQTLELFYLSSALWGAVCVTLAVTLAELSRPLLAGKVTRWLPAVVLVLLPLAYELHRHYPAFVWTPYGFVIVAVGLVGVAAGRLLAKKQKGWAAPVARALAVVLLAASVLALTVAVQKKHGPIRGVLGHPNPDYGLALAGNGAMAVHAYEISSQIPAFVGNAAYRGEVLFTWWSLKQAGQVEPSAGLYHAARMSVLTRPPHLTADDRRWLRRNRPAEMLVLTSKSVPTASLLAALAPFDPSLVRARVFRSSPATVHAWLISLGLFSRQANG
jgi:hypothetical protein